MKSNFYTISIEEALAPFITQVQAMVDIRHLNTFRPLSQYSLCKACENVNTAVMGFISTAESISANYPYISSEMTNTCNWSRSLVSKILDNTLYGSDPHSDTKTSSLSKISMGSQQKIPQFNSWDSRPLKQQHSSATFSQFAEGLLKAIERILLLADWIIVLDIRRAIIKVIQSLSDMDSKGVENFPTFMHMFSRFGSDMVQLGELTGQRQLDLKDTKLRCLVAFIRSMLERVTMMILAAWKINFRHDSRSTRTLRALVFQHSNHLLDFLMAFLVVSHPLYPELSKEFRNEFKDVCDDVGFLEKESQNLYEKIFSLDQTFIWEILKKLKELVSILNSETNINNSNKSELESRMDTALTLVTELLNAGQLFTQCSFISLTERQHIISLCRRLRVQLRSCFESSKGDETNSADRSYHARQFVEDLCDQILTVLFDITVKYGDDILNYAIHFTNEIEAPGSQSFKGSVDFRKPPRPGVSQSKISETINITDDKLQGFETNSTDGSFQSALANSRFTSVDFGILKIKIMTICKFLAHTSMSREISLVCCLTEELVENFAHMITLATQIFNEVSVSKHAKDCTDVLLDIWVNLINDIINIKEDINDWKNHKYSSNHYPFNYDSLSSTEIMKNYKIFQSLSINDSNVDNNSVVTPFGNQVKHTTPRSSPSRNQIHQTLSMNSLTRERQCSGPILTGNHSESPNPWLSVAEIERIILMKGRVIIDLATQITMFSHNEGPLKTSADLMITLQQLVREVANFHAFSERNIINDLILPFLDKFPSLILSLCSEQNQEVNTRADMFLKIDRIVELVRHTASVVTMVMTNWKSQTQLAKPFRSASVLNNATCFGNINSTPPISSNKIRSNVDEISDSKSCFSDTTPNALYRNSKFLPPRSSSLGRKLNIENL